MLLFTCVEGNWETARHWVMFARFEHEESLVVHVNMFLFLQEGTDHQGCTSLAALQLSLASTRLSPWPAVVAQQIPMRSTTLITQTLSLGLLKGKSPSVGALVIVA